MSFVFAAPQELASAATDLAGIGSTLGAANAAAVAPTTGVVASAADQVSAQVAALLSEHGLGYQQVSAQMAAFHERFVQTLTAGAGAFAQTEANAAQSLAHAVSAPGAALPGVPSAASGIGAGASTAAGAVSNAVSRIGGSVLGSNFSGVASQASTLLAPTGGVGALTAARSLIAPAAMTNAAVVPAASGSLGDAIKAGYLLIEPYVQYGFDLAAYAVGFVPYVGYLAPQIYFFYDLIEPLVQSGLFNTIDVLQGSITFATGLSNFFDTTTASINYFIQNEINWLFGYILPPLPPLPPFFP
jgi:hypothetical protein